MLKPRSSAFLAAVSLTLLLAACDPAPGALPAPPPSAAAAAAATVAPPPEEPTPPPPPPADLDPAPMREALECSGSKKSGACAVLAQLEACKPWSASVPSSDGRWVGRGFRVEGGKTTDKVAMLRLRGVPANEVGPGQLPGRLALATVGPEDGAVFAQADRALRPLESGDVPPRNNATIEHVRSRSEWSEAYLTRTVKGHVYAIAHGGLHVCEGPRRQLVIVERAATRGAPADGLYAELWATSW